MYFRVAYDIFSTDGESKNGFVCSAGSNKMHLRPASRKSNISLQFEEISK